MKNDVMNGDAPPSFHGKYGMKVEQQNEKIYLLIPNSLLICWGQFFCAEIKIGT